MSAIKETIIACVQCGRKYVDLETQGIMCDSCQQYNQVEFNLERALRETRATHNGWLSCQKIARILTEVFDKSEIQAIIKELMKYEI